MLLISLSHDIKTPLNAIALYAKAISRNLYKDEEKKHEVAENIHTKVGEIEKYSNCLLSGDKERLMEGEILADIVQNENERIMQMKVILRYI